MVIAHIFYALDRFLGRCSNYCWEQAKKYDPQWEHDSGRWEWKSDDPFPSVLESPERE